MRTYHDGSILRVKWIDNKVVATLFCSDDDSVYSEDSNDEPIFAEKTLRPSRTSIHHS